MLFENPREWTRSAVGSWWRFAFMAIGCVGLMIYAVYAAAESGLRSGLSVAALPIIFQLLFLYALRRMYLQAIGAESEREDV